MPAKEKGKFEDMANADKARYEREMKTYIPPKGETKKKFKDPNAPKRPPSAFYLFCSEYRPKIKGEHPGLSIDDVAKKLGEMWNNTDNKQPYGKKAAELKERYGKESAAYRAKGKPVAFSIATNLAWYSLGVVNWHGNLKQVLVGAQHKLVIYGDGSYFVFLFVCLFCWGFFHLQLSDAAYMKIIVVLLTEYHSVIAKKNAAILLTF
ncbi:High mobility group protein B1 (Fragment) [Lemmus lemmus]